MEVEKSVKEEKTNGVITPQQDRKPRKEKTSKRKEDRSVDGVMKALEHLPTAAEKFEVLRSKYAELADDSKKYQLMEKKLVMMQREKEQIQQDHTKSTITRTRLEQLCRELQKQNKAIKEESLLKIREEEEKRKELSAKFNATMTEITALMQQNSESNLKLRDENQSMQNQFKGVCEQYELREQQVEKMGQQLKLESQLAEAKLAKARLELQAQQDLMEREKALMMAEVARCQAKCQDHEKIEASLRAQIKVYFEKYDEFQTVLNKSNQVYSGFKTEMDKMSKKITRLEKETASWKQKWEGTHKALLSLAAEKQQKDEEVAQQARQLTKLKQLCRTVTNERSALMQQLKDHGITPTKESNSEETLESQMSLKSDDQPKIVEDSVATKSVPSGDTVPASSIVDVESPEKISTSKVDEVTVNKVVTETAVAESVVTKEEVPNEEIKLPVVPVDNIVAENQEVSSAAPESPKNSSPEEVSSGGQANVSSPENPSSSQAVETKSAETDAVDKTGLAQEEAPLLIPSERNTPRVPPKEVLEIKEAVPNAAPTVAAVAAQPEQNKTPSISASSPTVAPSTHNKTAAASPKTANAAQSKKTPPQMEQQKKIKDGSKRRKK